MHTFLYYHTGKTTKKLGGLSSHQSVSADRNIIMILTLLFSSA